MGIDCLLVPSRFEGLGRVVVEAAYVAVPSIATGVGGLPETMVDGKTGLLVGDFESEPERARILEILRDRGHLRQMGIAAREFCMARFSPAVAADKTLSVYAEVLARRRRTRP